MCDAMFPHLSHTLLHNSVFSARKANAVISFIMMSAKSKKLGIIMMLCTGVLKSND